MINYEPYFAHETRSLNLIMTYTKGVFRFSQPSFSIEWSEDSFVPEEVIKRYTDAEISDLVSFWKKAGHPLKVKPPRKVEEE